MPTPECWQELGQKLGVLTATIDSVKESVERIEEKFEKETKEIKDDISNFKLDRARATAIGAAFALILPGIGVIFGEPIRAIVKNLLR